VGSMRKVFFLNRTTWDVTKTTYEAANS
jgi:hypothetical protein